MKINKKFASVLVPAVLCTAVAAAPASEKKAAPARQMPIPPVLVDKVITAPDIITRRYIGNILPISNVYSVSKVSGDLVHQGFKDGDFVKKGQLLFKIDPLRYEAAVKSAEAKLAQIKAKLAYAESNLSRKQELFSKKAVSLDTFQSVLCERDSLKAQLSDAEAALILAKDDLANTRIVSMTDGKTGKAAYAPGNYITPGSGTLVQTVQTDPIRVRFAISARDFLSVFGNEENMRKTAKIKIKLADDSIYPLTGSIEIVDAAVQTQSDTLRVWARFSNPDNRLIPYGVVGVQLTRDDQKLYPAVLPSAIMHDRKGSYVYVVDSKTSMPERRYVQLGNATEKLQVVKSGVKPGETVIVEGLHKVIPGVPVKAVVRGDK